MLHALESKDYKENMWTLKELADFKKSGDIFHIRLSVIKLVLGFNFIISSDLNPSCS